MKVYELFSESRTLKFTLYMVSAANSLEGDSAMTRYIAQHTLPWTEEDVNKLIEQGMPQMPEGLAWKTTFCSFPEHKFFCEWEAPSAESIEQFLKASQMPYDVIYPVRRFDVAERQMEP